jgi:DNA replication protein DnaC
LDDLGTEAATPWASAKLYQLFDYRYVTRLPTVVTTTYRLEDLEKAVDPRLVTRMRDKRLCTMFAILAGAYVGERARPRQRS